MTRRALIMVNLNFTFSRFLPNVVFRFDKEADETDSSADEDDDGIEKHTFHCNIFKKKKWKIK